VLHFLFEPGLLASSPVRNAALIGAITAIVSAIVGVFTVVRSQSFAGHALTDITTAGGSGAFFFGFSPLVGFLSASVVGASAMDLIGVQRLRSRDVATGVVLGAGIGLAALFLFLDSTRAASAGLTQQILFGSIFSVDPSTIPLVIVMSALTLVVMFFIFRPLLLSSMSVELAAARGINLRVVGGLFFINNTAQKQTPADGPPGPTILGGGNPGGGNQQ
jgi:zinc/manganese transport system permease protein